MREPGTADDPGARGQGSINLIPPFNPTDEESSHSRRWEKKTREKIDRQTRRRWDRENGERDRRRVSRPADTQTTSPCPPCAGQDRTDERDGTPRRLMNVYRTHALTHSLTHTRYMPVLTIVRERHNRRTPIHPARARVRLHLLWYWRVFRTSSHFYRRICSWARPRSQTLSETSHGSWGRRIRAFWFPAWGCSDKPFAVGRTGRAARIRRAQAAAFYPVRTRHGRNNRGDRDKMIPMTTRQNGDRDQPLRLLPYGLVALRGRRAAISPPSAVTSRGWRTSGAKVAQVAGRKAREFESPPPEICPFSEASPFPHLQHVLTFTNLSIVGVYERYSIIIYCYWCL